MIVDPKKREEALSELVTKIKKRNQDKPYDCVIGVSGGVDSTYLAYYVHQLGLRPLAIHVDNGWNTQLSLDNIAKLMKKINVELHTQVLDWDEFKNLQLAFLRASVPDLEIPTDHALIAYLRHTTIKNDLKYLILGTNLRTESILPRAWAQGHSDWRYIRSLNQRFGSGALTTFPHTTYCEAVDQEFNGQITLVSLLDYLDYSKTEAIKTLEKDLGWEYYGGKHYESTYTRFIQGHILPVKFNFDKRRAHLSCLIVSGEITREQALEELKKTDYPEEVMMADRKEVLEKLGLSEDEFNHLMSLPPKRFDDYPSYASLNWLGRLGLRLYKSFKKRKARFL